MAGIHVKYRADKHAVRVRAECLAHLQRVSPAATAPQVDSEPSSDAEPTNRAERRRARRKGQR